MNRIGIDVFTRDKEKLMTNLKGLTGTYDIRDGGRYHEDPAYSQIHIDTSLSEVEVEQWLYRTNQPYVGTFARM